MSHIGKPLTLVNLISTQMSHAAPPAGPTIFEIEDNLVFANENLGQRFAEKVDMAEMLMPYIEDEAA